MSPTGIQSLVLVLLITTPANRQRARILYVAMENRVVSLESLCQGESNVCARPKTLDGPAPRANVLAWPRRLGRPFTV
jgi:hypothetical protein